MPSSRRLQLGGLVALAAASALVLHAVGSGDLAAPPVEGKEEGPLTCLIGSVVGPTCCTATTTATATAKDSH